MGTEWEQEDKKNVQWNKKNIMKISLPNSRIPPNMEIV